MGWVPGVLYHDLWDLKLGQIAGSLGLLDRPFNEPREFVSNPDYLQL